ncbi:MAG: LuxR C-terminal-related transcriptional regulator [Acidimicrobiia bacterium]
MTDAGPEFADEAAQSERAAGLAYFTADYTAARSHLEAAFRAHRDAGRPAHAAHMAMELAEMHASLFGNAAAANGWLSRASRLLEPLGDVVERGYLELAIMACDRPDVADLAASAERALGVARRFGDTDLEVRALADGGLAMVCQGRLREGFALLDEALAALTVGDCRRPETAPKSLCSLLTSCDRAGDLRRADEWTRLIQDALLVDGGPTVLAEHCRIVQSGILTAAGRWEEAEASLTTVLTAMASSAPHRAETMARLAELRLHRGQLEDAASLIAPHQDSVTMRAPLARLHLLRGEAADAVAVAELGLRDLVADRLRGAPLLDVVVQAELLRGDATAAARAAERLTLLAETAESDALRADAACARGRVAAARGDTAVAVDELTAATRGFETSARPLHAGAARLELAQVFASGGDTASAAAEARAALVVFERLGAASMVDRVLNVLRALGARVRSRTDSAAAVADLTAREAEVLDLIRQGLTNVEIGRRLYISAKTAEHHVGRMLAKLGVRTRTEAAALAATARAAGTPRHAE